MNEFNAVVGKAYMLDTTITPGAKDYKSIMHLGEGATSIEAVGKMLFYYLTGAAVPLTIQGSPTSTTIEPLKQGLSQLKLATSINGVNEGLIEQIDVFGDLAGIAGTGFASAKIRIHNPLDTPFTLKHIKASTTQYMTCNNAGSARYTNQEIGTIDYELPSPLVIPPKSSVTSDDWPVAIDLTRLDIVMSAITSGERFYNVTQTASVVVGDGFESSEMYYTQQNVPYTIEIPELTGMSPEEMQAFCDAPPAGGLGFLSLNNGTANATSSVISSSALPTSTLLPTGSTELPSSSTIVQTTTDEAKPTTTDEAEPTTTDESQPTTTEEEDQPTTTEKETVETTEPAAQSTA